MAYCDAVGFLFTLLVAVGADCNSRTCPGGSSEDTLSLLQTQVKHTLGAAGVEQTKRQAEKPYYWPSGHGLPKNYGYSEWAGPKDLNASFSWKWHSPDGKYATLPYGINIDGHKNLYVTTDTSVWKFDENGTVLWSFKPEPLKPPATSVKPPTLYNAGSIADGRMHFSTLDGRIWAISMETGKPLWESRVCEHINNDNGFVTVADGVVLAATDAMMSVRGDANGVVRGVNATDGRSLWTYMPEKPVWNFMGNHANDGTFLYQDWEGRAYRHSLKDGSLIWKRGGYGGSWTDGIPYMGGNGIFYTVAAYMERRNSTIQGLLASMLGPPGAITAFNLSNGAQLFSSPVPMPPNALPTMGVLPGTTGESIIVPGGWQGVKGGETGIYAYDAITGAKRDWEFIGPSQANDNQAGEVEGLAERALFGATAAYVTNPWSAPTIDKDGTVYIGHEDGLLFALRDKNGDGKLEGSDELMSYDTKAAFAGCSSPAHAPGLMAVGNMFGVFTFKQ